MAVVVDASALVELLIRSSAAPAVEDILAAEPSFAPELLDVEVASALAGLRRSRKLSSGGARRALGALARAPIARAPHAPLLGEVWEMRDAISIYDAFYVALAHVLGCPLVTGDRRLAGVAAVRVPVTLVR